MAHNAEDIIESRSEGEERGEERQRVGTYRFEFDLFEGVFQLLLGAILCKNINDPKIIPNFDGSVGFVDTLDTAVIGGEHGLDGSAKDVRASGRDLP